MEWVKSYTPGYFYSCLSLFKLNLGNCSNLSNDFEKNKCLNEFNKKYGEMIGTSILDSINNNTPWDLSSTSKEEMINSYQKYLDGELFQSIYSNILKNYLKFDKKTVYDK